MKCSFSTGSISSYLVLGLLLCFNSEAFHVFNFHNVPSTIRSNILEERREFGSRLCSFPEDKNGSFDMSKPTFDLLTLRFDVRGDAIIRYNSLNQSEPLRINIYLLATLSLFSYSTISESVLEEPATPVGLFLSVASGIFTLNRFFRECGRRSRKLNKIEKELNAERLKIRLPTGKFADRPFGGPPTQLKELKGNKRVLTIFGKNAKELRSAMVPIRAFRQRFDQSSTLVVVIAMDKSSAVDWGISVEERKSNPFLAEVENMEEWISYFSSLLNNKNDNLDDINLAWFGLTFNGKSFGSGVGRLPRIIEILGQSLTPSLELSYRASTVVLDAEKDVLSSQNIFYNALTSGDMTSLKKICNEDYNAPEVNEILDNGGRIDNWEKCLDDGSRPSGMKISDSDVLIVSDTEAYSTTIEFPLLEGGTFDYSPSTLLAFQRWSRCGNSGEWKLQVHQTIPWNQLKAGGTLVCDSRGCAALVRTQKEQWNFKGLIS